MELERALTKLRYDDSVSGYALFTNDGHPFLSFSLPEETLPVIQGTLRIHSSSLNLMNIMTDAGTVVLARVDKKWIMAVLFSAEETLGSALQKTQDVVRLLENTILPSPPQRSAIAEPVPDQIQISPEPIQALEFDPEIIPLDQVDVRHGCIVFQGQLFSKATLFDSEVSMGLKEQFANVGSDVLMMVDGKKTPVKIAESLDKTVEYVITIIRWCVSRSIVRVECPKEQAPSAREIVELPLFEGDLKKANKQHRQILEQCDGTKTLQDIAKILGIDYFQALQSIIPYKGKTITMVKKIL